MRNKYIFCLVVIVFLFSNLCLSLGVAGEDCNIPDSVLDIKTPIEKVKALTELVFKKSQEDSLDCVIPILKEAAKTTAKIESGQDRTIAGYEIKDVVFNFLKDEEMEHYKNMNTAIYLSLQSMTEDLTVSKESSMIERVNDATFLFKVSEYLKENGKTEDSTKFLLLMLRISKTLDNSKIPYNSYNLSQFLEWLLKRSKFSNIVQVLEEIPHDENKAYLVNSLRNAIPYNLASISTYNKAEQTNKQKFLIYADGAEELLKVLLKETEGQQYFSNVVKKNGKSTNRWIIALHKFIWQIYFIAGDPQDANKKLVIWISEIRRIEDSIMRIGAMTDASLVMYSAGVDKQFIISLLNEAEEETKKIDDPKFRINKLENIANMKKHMNIK